MKSGSVRKSSVRAWMLGTVFAAAVAGCGDSGTQDAAPFPPPPPASSLHGYAYVASADGQGQSVPGAVYQFLVKDDLSLNPLAKLTPLATPSVPTGVTPTALVAGPSGRFVYVVSAGDMTISQYAVTSGGALAPLSPPSLNISQSLGPVNYYYASVHPAGRFLYVVSYPPKAVGASPQFESYIAQYAIDSSNSPGALSLVTTSYTGYASSSPLAIDPSGHHAYMAAGGAVLPFTIQADGTLSAMTPVSVTPAALRVVLSQDGHFAYVLSYGQVETYTVDATGELIPAGATMIMGGYDVYPVDLAIDCVPATSGSGASIPSVACTGPGQFAYLLMDSMGVDTNATSLFGYAIQPNGTLAADPQIPEATFGGSAVAARAAGDVYVLSGRGSPLLTGGQLAAYSPALTALGSTPVAGRPTAMAIVLLPSPLL
jgi:hypothetical protein